jgi:hypothetical protein
MKMVLAAGFAPVLATLSTSCLCWLDYASEPEEENWRNAVDLRHTLPKESALVSTEARPAGPVDIPKWLAEPNLGERRLVRMAGFAPATFPS